ncbi:Dabb family protein [Hydrotalea sp.]|uniref:Dabb family protein n=1 Tax=Hydrotalea sp. TaxID=2881279 RepID=UPI0026217F25|nr:Dabb family protein [Hydrotalea sp.]
MIPPDYFIHHVYFWLKEPDSHAAHQQLYKGLQALSKVPEIKSFHIGVPASTNRNVIERGYHFSWLAIFENITEEEIYQTHPIHLHFIETCSHLWEKVVVFDSVQPNNYY